ncbi:hypothetical protein [Rhizobium sp. PL01]|uniref:hypothetical protein n=1 Tax=Rhizobium sp. PL01 TaxID=3085631 RepID=UPI002980F7CC|nr:hypothetical protein [Rhizobium sp. PL01]MDW5316877.1 hypothetical protein [Rhizobium sp. PL01]
MKLILRQNMQPFLRDENGHVAMTDGQTDWLVIVTKEALEAISMPPLADDQRLLDHLQSFIEIATFKLERGREGEEKTIWVQSDDIREWQQARPQA